MIMTYCMLKYSHHSIPGRCLNRVVAYILFKLLRPLGREKMAKITLPECGDVVVRGGVTHDTAIFESCMTSRPREKAKEERVKTSVIDTRCAFIRRSTNGLLGQN